MLTIILHFWHSCIAHHFLMCELLHAHLRCLDESYVMIIHIACCPVDRSTGTVIRVSHMMSDKAGSCVSRGMLVVDAALQTVIFLMIVVTDGDWDGLGWVWDRRGVWLAPGCLWGDVFTSADAAACVQQLQETVSKFIVELSRLCTAELWLQFVHYMETSWLCMYQSWAP